ncbi:MAG: sulfatase/phosphatase domain-containing protein [Spirochaetales bacterium]
MCNRIDCQFGMVLEALKERGFYEDTAAFFFSDHGDFAGDYGLVEKTQNTFEDVLVRVPFVAKLPAGVVRVHGTSEAMVEVLDLPATVFELAGIEPDHWHFGRSLVPLLRGERSEHRDEVHCEGGRLRGETAAMELPSLRAFDAPEESLYFPRVGLQASDERDWHTKATMFRTKRFKYVRRLYEQDELYDLEVDPGEQRNTISDPAFAEVLAEMKERMLRWYQETADVVPFATDARS